MENKEIVKSFRLSEELDKKVNNYLESLVIKEKSKYGNYTYDTYTDKNGKKIWYKYTRSNLIVDLLKEHLEKVEKAKAKKSAADKCNTNLGQ